MATVIEVGTNGIEVHALDASERRLLLELLASERAGDDALLVTGLGRDRVAQRLSEHGIVAWVSVDRVMLTDLGLYVAERLADRLVRGSRRRLV